MKRLVAIMVLAGLCLGCDFKIESPERSPLPSVTENYGPDINPGGSAPGPGVQKAAEDALEDE